MGKRNIVSALIVMTACLKAQLKRSLKRHRRQSEFKVKHNGITIGVFVGKRKDKYQEALKHMRFMNESYNTNNVFLTERIINY